MGLNDEEIVALSGAHTFGRAYKDRSGAGAEKLSIPMGPVQRYCGPMGRKPNTIPVVHRGRNNGWCLIIRIIKPSLIQMRIRSY